MPRRCLTKIQSAIIDKKQSLQAASVAVAPWGYQQVKMHGQGPWPGRRREPGREAGNNATAPCEYERGVAPHGVAASQYYARHDLPLQAGSTIFLMGVKPGTAVGHRRTVPAVLAAPEGLLCPDLYKREESSRPEPHQRTGMQRPRPGPHQEAVSKQSQDNGRDSRKPLVTMRINPAILRPLQ